MGSPSRVAFTCRLAVFVCLNFITVVSPQSVVAADDWHLLGIPEAWRSVPRGELSPEGGYSWYRTLVRLPENWAGSELTLYVEALDDARSVWVAGETVGVLGSFPPQFRSGLGERGGFRIGTDLLDGLDHFVVAIRVYQSDPRPNFSVAPPVLMNSSRMEAMRLAGKWQYRPGDSSLWAQADPGEFGVDGLLKQLPELPDGIFGLTEKVDDIEAYVNRRSGDTPALSPADALARFQTSEDIAVELVLSDSKIAQPLFMTWDARGRLWVMEYRQYPNPAGLKMLSRDTYLRTVYDRVPQAPPNHVRGADRISIHEDTDGDGFPDAHSVFVDGLNIATSFAIGRGGVYVTNPPYLLFYPDANGDDVPDGDPEVLLEGFGLEDSHSVINSLRFGPDGWLYGAQGSTVTAAVKAPGSEQEPIRSMGQLIWRYHPERRVYEVFAEGGGNTFGCEIDAVGRVFSGHNGGNTRGFHYVQGGYYRKGFGKHGPLSNPFTFGFYEQMKHHDVARFTHNFVLYEDDLLPARFHGQLLGIEPLQGQVVLSDVEPNQTSVATKDIERVLTTDDPWFRPVDIKCGPDGAVYIADLYEQRIDHSSHYAGRVDRTTGRIYRVVPAKKRGPATASELVSATDSAKLLKQLEHPTRWHRQTAVRVLGDRPLDVADDIWALLQQESGPRALDKLWALHAANGLTEQRALQLLSHPQATVRAWTVRILCDAVQELSPAVADALVKLSRLEGYPEVRLQLAASSRRLPAKQAIPMIAMLLTHEEDAGDIFIPLMIWWSVESHVDALKPSELLALLIPESRLWDSPFVQQRILELLMRRYSSSSRPELLSGAAMLLRQAPDAQVREILLKGFESAFAGRSLATLPADLSAALADVGGGSLALRLRRGDPNAVAEATESILDASGKVDQRISLIEICGQPGLESMLPVLQKLVLTESTDSVLAAAIAALQNFPQAELAADVLGRFAGLQGEARLAAESMLVSRPEWASSLLDQIERGQLNDDQITLFGIRQVRMHGGFVEQRAEKIWGPPGGMAAADALAEMDKLRDFLAAGSGNPRTGKRLFAQHCGRCHRLFAEGGQVGPDLTPFTRQDNDRMLSSIVNPALEIREGYETFIVITTNGRIVSGFLVQNDDQIVVLRGVDGQNQIVRRVDIEEMNASPQSVMPEGLLRNLDQQQVRDLFAYLRSTQPVNY